METINRNLRLAFYDASDGPRIMVFGPLEADFQTLQAIFRTLSQGEGSFELNRLSFIHPFGDIRIVALSGASICQSDQPKQQGVRRVGSANSREFTWHRTAEGWDSLAELIDGLVRNANPCHQYLSSYPKEDAIIVLSKGEYGDEVLERGEKGTSGGKGDIVEWH